MVFLGFGKFARADKIYALEPLTGKQRGGGSRTRVWVEGISEPIVASRTERSILTEMGVRDAGRVKIDNVRQLLESEQVVYTADIACPEIRFLGLGERRATARYLITPGLRYRLLARALKDDFEQQKDSIEAFFSSFRVLAPEKKNP